MLKTTYVYLFFVLSLFLWAATWRGIDSNSRGVVGYSASLNWINYYDEREADTMLFMIIEEYAKLNEEYLIQNQDPIHFAVPCS